MGGARRAHKGRVSMPHGRFRLFTAGLVTRALLPVGAVAMLALSSGASAAPVPFNITAAQFVIPGSAEYGQDFDEDHGTLLDVRFSNSVFSPQSFTLSTLNQFATFNVGSIDLEEPNSGHGILADETDHLDISARLTFTAPTGITQTITATATAFVHNSVTDNAVDYVLDWSPVLVSFGTGGQFRIDLTDMSFNGLGNQFQTATFTLLSFSDTLPPSNVPEPASIALLGIGIGCAAVTRRRRTKA